MLSCITNLEIGNLEVINNVKIEKISSLGILE